MAYRSGWPWWAASVIRINIGIYVVVSFRFISILLINCVFGLHVLDLVSNTTQYTTNDDGVDNDAPVETQSAQCTITAGDVKAQAQATISKKLEGICSTSKEQQHMATQMISLNSFFFTLCRAIERFISNSRLQNHEWIVDHQDDDLPKSFTAVAASFTSDSAVCNAIQLLPADCECSNDAICTIEWSASAESNTGGRKTGCSTGIWDSSSGSGHRNKYSRCR